MQVPVVSPFPIFPLHYGMDVKVLSATKSDYLLIVYLTNFL